MSRNTLQIVASVYCVVVLATAAWFWREQVQSVVDLLRIAYG